MESNEIPYQIKNNFYLPQNGEAIYLLSHSVGARLKNSDLAISTYLKEWDQGGQEAWKDWPLHLHRFQKELAKLLGGEGGEKEINPNQFCPQTNLSSALSKILYALKPITNAAYSSSSFQKSQKKTLLLSPYDFPSMGYVFQMAKKLHPNIEVRFLPPEVDDVHHHLEVWEKELTDDVCLALITHVFSNNGQRQNVEMITKMCQERSIISVVDIAQSVGIIPIDLNQWCADFVLGTTMKWCCAGPGASFLWASQDSLINSTPQDVGWFSHDDPFEFDIHHFSYAQSGWRFLGGTPSILPFAISAETLSYLNSIGSKKIWKHNQDLVHYLIRSLQEKGFTLISPLETEHHGGTVVIEHQEAELIQKQLIAKNIITDTRSHKSKNIIRLSPHLYTQKNDLDILLSEIRK